MAAPKAFKKNDLNIQYLDIVDEELEIDSAKTISRANMQIDPLGDGVFSVKAGNIEKFQVNVHNFENLYQVIEGTPTAFASAQAVLDFFFDYVGSGGGTTDNGVYLCNISYMGNGDAGDMAMLQGIIINGDEYTGLSVSLDDFGAVRDIINDQLTASGITNVGTLVTKGITGNISNNTGSIDVFVQILYPSVALTCEIILLINGQTSGYSFDKIPTS